MGKTIDSFISEFGIEQIKDVLVFFLVLGIAVLAHFVIRRIVLKFVRRIAHKSKIKWDDKLVEYRFFHHLVGFIPLGVVRYIDEWIFADSPLLLSVVNVISKLIALWFTVHLITVAIRVFVVYVEYSKKRNLIATKSLAQFSIIVLYVFFGVLGVSILLSLDLSTIFTGLSALTAVIVVVFKDTITGFVSSLQIANSEIVEIGDWITLPKFEADGEVISINLVNTQVRNWDKTIVNVPTSSLVSGSVRNWSSMAKSNTRRIKRELFMDVKNFRFLNLEEIEILSQNKGLKNYFDQKKKEHPDLSKKLTNIGTFRKYIELYLASHPKISAQQDTIMVRQKEPTPYGLPLEVYCFTNISDWKEYEQIQADIFDHILTIAPDFSLHIFQYRTDPKH